MCGSRPSVPCDSLAARPCGTGESRPAPVPADTTVAACPAGPDGASGVADSTWSGRSVPGVAGAVGLSGLRRRVRRPASSGRCRGTGTFRVSGAAAARSTAASIGVMRRGSGWHLRTCGCSMPEASASPRPAWGGTTAGGAVGDRAARGGGAGLSFGYKAKITLDLRETFVPWSISVRRPAVGRAASPAVFTSPTLLRRPVLGAPAPNAIRKGTISSLPVCAATLFLSGRASPACERPSLRPAAACRHVLLRMQHTALISMAQPLLEQPHAPYPRHAESVVRREIPALRIPGAGGVRGARYAL